MNLGESVKSIRKAKGLKAVELAKLSGLSHTAIYHIEHDKHFPSKKTIESIAQALNVSVGLILFNSVTEEDIPEEKRSAFSIIKETIKQLFV